MSTISPSDRLQLERLISAYNAKDTTEKIRSLRHSGRIRDDLRALLALKEKFPRIHKDDPSRFRSLAESRCAFIYTNYTDIFIRAVKDELNLNIMWNFLGVLEAIEDGKIDQHEGSYLVGKALKELYVDSALQAEEKRKEAEARKEKRERAKGVRGPASTTKKMSWADYKAMMEKAGQAGSSDVTDIVEEASESATSTDVTTTPVEHSE